jgi:beta-lactamase class C
MNKRNRYIFLAILLLALPLILAQVLVSKKAEGNIAVAKTLPPAPKPDPNPFIVKLLADYERKIDSLSNRSHTPGAAVAIVYDTTIIFLKGVGVRKVGTHDLVDTHTVFRLASVSKCFASFLTGILVEDSVLHWGDHVVQYLPGFSLESAEETQKLTLAHVLSHTTGLPYHTYTNMVEEGEGITTLLNRLKDVKLSAGVGKEYSYQNVGYSIIGEVMKSATGKGYDTLLQEKVFTPLKMLDASARYFSIVENPNHATPHLYRRGKLTPARITDTYYNVAPAGGVNASISDMANWMVALLGNQKEIISAQTLDTLYSPFIRAHSKNRNYGRVHRIRKAYYGLGWRVLHYPNDTVIYHGGYVNGYRSEVAVNPKSRMAICILANAPGELADNGIPVFYNLLYNKRDSIQAWEDRQRKKHNQKVMLP